MKEYVLGFAFNEERTKVVLIGKKRPEYQAGKLNGVGGKLEPAEFACDAMLREFKEETGIQTTHTEWNKVCIISHRDYKIHVYSLFDDWVFNEAHTTTDEEIMKFNVWDIGLHSCMNYMKWLIPMILDLKEHESRVSVTYPG